MVVVGVLVVAVDAALLSPVLFLVSSVSFLFIVAVVVVVATAISLVVFIFVVAL